ncbi:MAG: hypothetical protein ACTSUD_02615 [Alphaproteobacteria bacterium]
MKINRLFALLFAAVAFNGIALLAPAPATAQGYVYQRPTTVRFQIRHTRPGYSCSVWGSGFFQRYFKYTGPRARNWCVRCPSGYSFMRHAATYSCAKCPSGFQVFNRPAGYPGCRRWK